MSLIKWIYEFLFLPPQSAPMPPRRPIRWRLVEYEVSHDGQVEITVYERIRD